MIELENEFIKAKIVLKGAELQSLFGKQTGIEYMWSGDKKYWGKHSPVLFPIVGGLKNDTFFYKNKEYALPRHGFARDSEFEVLKNTQTEVLFSLQSNTNSIKIYPFNFILQIKYTLKKNGIACCYQVINTQKEELLFSIGAHPAFAVPMQNNNHYNDYYLQFNDHELLNRWKLKDGLIDTKSDRLDTKDGRLNLSAALFYEDAIVLKNIQSNCITLGCNKHQHGLHFYFNNFNYFGIWAAKDAPFICLEPWAGIADNIHHNGQLTEKEGINFLAQNDIWKREWSVECF